MKCNNKRVNWSLFYFHSLTWKQINNQESWTPWEDKVLKKTGKMLVPGQISKELPRDGCSPAWENCGSLLQREGNLCRGGSASPAASQRKALKALTFPLTTTLISECKHLWKRINQQERRNCGCLGPGWDYQRKCRPEQATAKLLKVLIP